MSFTPTPSVLARVFLRGSVSFDFDLGRLTPEELQRLTNRPKRVIFRIENELLRPVYSYQIDHTNRRLSLAFIPQRWIPRRRPDLTQENVDNAILNAVKA